MNDYPLKMLIFNRARLVKNSKNRIPYGIELIQKQERDSWIVFTENKKQAKEFNKIVNKLKGFNSGIYNTDLNDDERQENLEKFKAGNLNVLVSCTALDEGFDMPEADGAMILIKTLTASAQPSIESPITNLLNLFSKGFVIVGNFLI